MGAQVLDRLIESSGPLNDILVKRLFETAEYEEVKNSVFWCGDTKSTRTT